MSGGNSRCNNNLHALIHLTGGGIRIASSHARGFAANQPPMELPLIVFRARIHLNPSQRAQVLRSLRRILGETRVLDGCISCRLYSDAEDETQLLLVEQWENMSHMKVHLCSESFLVVLSSLDYAIERPEVYFDTISRTDDGMDLIKACRQHGNEN